MAKNLLLTIPEPCHENWANMSPNDKGRFCGSCQKTVIDFTTMSDTQLVAFFKKKKSGNVCGRFYDDQLDTEMPIPVRSIPWVKYFFQITLPAFIASGNVMSQEQTGLQQQGKVEEVTVFLQCTPRKKQKTPVQVITVKGQITDEEGNGIPYASIVNNKTKAGFAADSLGNFTLKDVHLMEGSEYTVSAVGYTSSTMFASRINNNTPLVVSLVSNNTLEEVTLISYNNTRKGKIMLGGARTIIINSMTDNIMPLEKALSNGALKIYPNPVQINKNITLNFNNDTAGKYRYEILSMDGKIVTNGVKDCMMGNNILNLTIDNRFSAGTYILQLQNETGGNKQSAKFVVQR